MEKILKTEMEPGITFKQYLMRELLTQLNKSEDRNLAVLKAMYGERDVKAAVRYLFL